MKLLYDGYLNVVVAANIKDAHRKYSFVIEMNPLPDSWSKWAEESLKDYSSSVEDCNGGKYIHVSKSCCLVNNEESSVFIFLHSIKEKEAIINSWSRYVKNENPFKTIIG